MPGDRVRHCYPELDGEGSGCGEAELDVWVPHQRLAVRQQEAVVALALGGDGDVGGVPRHRERVQPELHGMTVVPDLRSAVRKAGWPFPGGMIPPSWVEVPATMTDWVDSLVTIATDANPVEALAAAHAGFERTHPFLVGNGRTGRILLNLLLVRLGYPPPSSTPATRNRYLHALRRADSSDPGPLGELIARSVTDNLYRFVVPAVAGPHRLVPIVALATRTQSVFTLRGHRAGSAQGPEGSRWPMAKHPRWVDEYVASKYQRTRIRTSTTCENAYSDSTRSCSKP